MKNAMFMVAVFMMALFSSASLRAQVSFGDAVKFNDEMCIRDSSYNNQEWNPMGSLARQNGHSREMGAILNSYLQVNPIQKLTLRTQFATNAHYRDVYKRQHL